MLKHRSLHSAILLGLLNLSASPTYALENVMAKDWFNTQENAQNKHQQFLNLHNNSCQFSNSGSVLSLAETIDRALCFNPETHQHWAKTQAAAAALGVAKANYLPKLGIGFNHTRSEQSFEGIPDPIESNTYSGSINVNWMLYDFGRMDAEVKQAQALIKTTEAMQDVSIQKTLLEASERYFSAIYAAAMLQAQQENETLAKDSLAIVEGQFSGGAVSLIDVLQVRDLASKATLARMQAQSELRQQQGLLASLVELPIHQPVLLPDHHEFEELDQQPLKPFETLNDHALTTHPELIKIQSEIAQLQEKLLRVEKEYLPSIQATAQIVETPNAKLSLSQPENFSQVGIELQIPIFQGFSTQYQIKQVQRELDEKQFAFEQTKKTVERQMWQAYVDWFNTFQQIQDTQKLIQSAEQTQQITMDRYRQGVGEILEWMMAQTNLASARLDFVNLLNAQRISRLRLASAMGNTALYELITDPKIDSGALNEPSKEK